MNIIVKSHKKHLCIVDCCYEIILKSAYLWALLFNYGSFIYWNLCAKVEILNQVKNKLFGSYGDAKDKSIFNYGIELDKFGGLTLDSTKFNKVVQEDMTGLKDLFLGKAENKGLGTQLKELFDDMTITGGVLDTYDKGISTRETNLNAEKEKAEKALNAKYEQLSLQFASYGAIINQMEASFSGLKLMIQQSTAS